MRRCSAPIEVAVQEVPPPRSRCARIVRRRRPAKRLPSNEKDAQLHRAGEWRDLQSQFPVSSIMPSARSRQMNMDATSTSSAAIQISCTSSCGEAKALSMQRPPLRLNTSYETCITL